MTIEMLRTIGRSLERGVATPALSVYDFTTAQAIVRASEWMQRPVILLIPSKVAEGDSGRRFVRALRALTDDADCPVFIQLDHATSMELIEDTVSAGAHSVLADGSKLPNEDNAAFVAMARERLGEDITVEAELGALAGDEDVADAQDAESMTDPDDVGDFLRESGAHLLAMAVGNVHGQYHRDPELDWPRIERIRQAAGTVPLVLHGASGLARADLASAASVGIGKVNININLRDVVLNLLTERTDTHRRSGLNLDPPIR